MGNPGMSSAPQARHSRQAQAQAHGRNAPLADFIDFGHLERYTMGEPALTQELLAMFCGEVRGFENEWRRDGLQDAQAERRALHRLKGSARAIGAFPLADAAAWLEKLLTGEEGSPTAAELADARADLSAHLDALRDACRRWHAQQEG